MTDTDRGPRNGGAERQLRMWLFIRKDLPMPPGKPAAQAGQGYATCLWLSRDRSEALIAEYMNGEQGKIAVGVKDEGELLSCVDACKAAGLVAVAIKDDWGGDMLLDGNTFAKQWESSWNSHDLDSIMSHYRNDIVFRSKKAIGIAGSGEIHGKQSLRDYWATALKRQPSLKFTVQDVFLGHDMLVISYLNHCGTLAAETLYFDADGLIYQAAACHRP